MTKTVNQKPKVVEKKFSRYFYSGINQFLMDLFKLFSAEIIQSPALKKRLTYELGPQGSLIVKGYRQIENLVLPFEILFLLDSITEHSVFVKISYAEAGQIFGQEIGLTIPFKDLSVERLVALVKNTYFLTN